MIKRNSFRIVLFTVLCIGALIIGLIFLLKDNLTPVSYEVNHSPDYAVSGDIPGLVAASDYVVSGHYEKFIENWDMGEQYMSEVYSFVVDESFLGDANGTIHVAVPHYVLLEHAVDGETYQAKLNLPNYSKPNFEKPYVLFLKKAQTKDVFAPASVPFQVEITTSDHVTLKANTANTEQTVKTKKNNTIHFNSEQLELASIDRITGLTKAKLFEEVKEQAALKQR